MPEGVGYSSGSNTVAASSLELNVLGRYWYGYNTTGPITNASGETTLFDFRAAVPLKLNWSPGAIINTLSQSNKVFGYRLYLNEVIVWAMLTIASTSNPEQEQSALVDKKFIVPQYTQVKITAQTTDDGGATFYGSLSGKDLA